LKSLGSRFDANGSARIDQDLIKRLSALSNKRATGNRIIHKRLIISILRMQINALSRPVHGFEYALPL
jgi:hypothetical protein